MYHGILNTRSNQTLALACLATLLCLGVPQRAIGQAVSEQQATAASEPLTNLQAFGKVEQIASGFQFVEGPTWSRDGSLYFTDIPAESIMRLTSAGNVELFLKPSGFANGLLFAGEQRLLACQMDGQLVAIDIHSKQVKPLATEYQGERFNACNDLALDQVGGIYFTDPRYRAPEPWPQGKEAFYYRDAAGKITRLGDDLQAPNGIGLSPDGKTLYVIPSMASEMMSYEVLSPGKLGNAHVFCRLKQLEDQTNGGGDGMAVDSQGNIYITSAAGVQVFGPHGDAIGIIECPEHPANCAFGGPDRKTLFITARTGLYQCQCPVTGN
ncbi:SMP-30/gluconolactonase/LRE family protein [Aureliella helgolandensis]|uniref:Gluconolactonase n=1 Tax=Aureliella helgolandensis TaxID=2527968 RepID=A0A518G6Z9_9BACT|nr:SMP-30/gluconolactonase/LRE family protein [Aureliella helgolandensis]QDV24356.1 Gluconolactonase precursor [Aureliella helgolandensis]